jgi:hypothetical protein
MPDNTFTAGTQARIKTQKKYFEFIQNEISNGHNSTYLELGADDGVFTNIVAQAQMFENIKIIEPNQKSRIKFRARLTSDSKIEFIDTLFHLNPEEEINLVAAIHVFDHLLNPSEILEKLNKQMGNGGHIFVVVHDENSLLRHLMKYRWPPFHLQHPQLFSQKSMNYLFGKFGFELIKSSRSRNYISTDSLFQFLEAYLGIPNKLISFIPSFTVPLFLGNKMYLFKKV